MRLVQAVLRALVVGVFVVPLFPVTTLAAASATITVTVQIRPPEPPPLPGALGVATHHALRFGRTTHSDIASQNAISSIALQRATMNIVEHS